MPTTVIESFWGRMQTELLNRQRWNTRIDLANAIFEYLEIWHNRRRRHSALGWLTPIEYEKIHNANNVARLSTDEVNKRGTDQGLVRALPSTTWAPVASTDVVDSPLGVRGVVM